MCLKLIRVIASPKVKISFVSFFFVISIEIPTFCIATQRTTHNFIVIFMEINIQTPFFAPSALTHNASSFYYNPQKKRIQLIFLLIVNKSRKSTIGIIVVMFFPFNKITIKKLLLSLSLPTISTSYIEERRIKEKITP